jgi:hypothetical protein
VVGQGKKIKAELYITFDAFLTANKLAHLGIQLALKKKASITIGQGKFEASAERPS